MLNKLVWQMSVRNLFRHRRRNVMLLLAICVAVGGVTAMNTLIRGYQTSLQDMAVENLTGHVKVHAPGYRDDPSIERGFVLTDQFEPPIDARDMIGWAPRIRVPAVIMSERESRGVQLVGVDPLAEHISFIAEVAFDGQFIKSPADSGLVIGAALAEQLETKVGRRLVIITQGADGLNREKGYRVVGTYDADGAVDSVTTSQIQESEPTSSTTQVLLATPPLPKVGSEPPVE